MNVNCMGILGLENSNLIKKRKPLQPFLGRVMGKCIVLI